MRPMEVWGLPIVRDEHKCGTKKGRPFLTGKA